MAASRARRTARRLGLAVALSGAAWAVWGAMAFGGRALVVRHPIHDPDAVLMLASHEWERLPALAELARQTPGAAVLLTRPGQPTPQNCYRCDERTDWLAGLGVDRARVTVLPPPVANTYEEALAARAYALEHGVRRLEVVTSPYHTRRALATFSVVFTESGVAIGMLPAVPSSEAPGQWWQGVDDRRYVAYEWAAIVWYAVRHGVPPSTDGGAS